MCINGRCLVSTESGQFGTAVRFPLIINIEDRLQGFVYHALRWPLGSKAFVATSPVVLR